MDLPPGAAAVINGVNGQLIVYPDKVRITRKGVFAKAYQGFFAGEKDIYYNQLGSVLVKQAGVATLGYISFASSGNVERRRRFFDAAHDENTVTFGRRVTPQFLENVRQYIEARMHAPRIATVPAPDAAEQLVKLADLRDRGIVSAEEYEAKRKELLARM